jgi:signal recognition particle subunit SRP54
MQNPHAALRKKKGDTGKRLTPKERAKLRKDREREARRKKREGKDGNRDPSAK